MLLSDPSRPPHTSFAWGARPVVVNFGSVSRACTPACTPWFALPLPLRLWGTALAAVLGCDQQQGVHFLVPSAWLGFSEWGFLVVGTSMPRSVSRRVACLHKAAAGGGGG